MDNKLVSKSDIPCILEDNKNFCETRNSKCYWILGQDRTYQINCPCYKPICPEWQRMKEDEICIYSSKKCDRKNPFVCQYYHRLNSINKTKDLNNE